MQRIGMMLFVALFLIGGAMSAQDVMTPDDIIKTRRVTSAVMSPDGAHIAYTLSIPREATEAAGGAYAELHVVSSKSGKSRSFLSGAVNVSGVKWNPDGSALSFLMKRGENSKRQVWSIAVDGGEASQLTKSATTVAAYQWHPSGKKIGYIAQEAPSAKEKALKTKGYNFIYYEENLKHRNLYLHDLATGEAEQLSKDMTVWDFKFSADGSKIAAGMSKVNLIDHRYAFHKVYLIDIATKSSSLLIDNPGKLGNYAFSPDGKSIAYTAAAAQSDHAVSSVYVQSLSAKKSTDLTIANFRGHAQWVDWQNKNTIIYKSNEGVATTLSTVSASGGKRKVVLNSEKTGVVFTNPTLSANKKQMAAVGSSGSIPGDVYVISGSKMKRLTNVNPWLANKTLGKQAPLSYPARDGQEIEGLMIYPVNYDKAKAYPLLIMVHGGPESNYSNGWLNRYANPGQALAGKGYLVFYPNYRSSTGYGQKFAKTGYNDAAGVEFDDIADAIDYLTKEGIADKKRVGLGGGSYGGFASAWFATRYTNYVRAVCMFVGISDLISKRGTTDIPYEELFVHSGKKLEEMWEQSLERSPIFYAHQSKTATLIYGGAADTRVHPSQSLELFRRMKMNDHPAVRLVQYPGEGHGNRKQVGQIDVVHRIIDWYDWYVKDLKPLDGPMPPLDISDKYGIELPK
ncbi:MAG: alpha/beta fold hydrolase [Calditrichia bacterium]